jgi:hypothetical protein
VKLTVPNGNTIREETSQFGNRGMCERSSQAVSDVSVTGSNGDITKHLDSAQSGRSIFCTPFEEGRLTVLTGPNGDVVQHDESIRSDSALPRT